MSMDVSSADATRPLLDALGLPELGKTSDFLYPPTCLAPLRYVGIGDVRSPPGDIDIDILRIDPTPPTTVIEPVRDILTGEIVEFRDVPVATVAIDDGSINRPLGNCDDYDLGSGAGVAFTPGGVLSAVEKTPVDTEAFLKSLDSGLNLLSAPFDKKEVNVADSEQLPELPDAPKIVPTAAPRPTAQRIAEASKTYAIADDWDTSLFASEVPNPALTFGFNLDVFQLRAIHRLEFNQTVFVSAPTSAGKTVIAQYAIALCRAHKMRAIYTSPIKALSNQKFRDLTRQFGDVGILTGDVAINKEASCVIMTTEILRSMLYHGADMLRDVEVVVFDECHYISNDERGVVWEECIILLPHHINMVFLSATVPNAMEIADWIGRTKQRIVYVQEHAKRPVPLEHALYTGDSNFYVVSKPGKLLDQNRLADAQLSLSTPPGRMDFSVEYWITFILSAESEKLLPILVFCFEQRLCERLADNLITLSLLNKKEKKHVRGFCRKAIMRLAKEDRELPQILTMATLLENGIAYHHGGVLPIVKEMVEILLADGYVKVLFCTSTFGMGLNVPARSCAFVTLRKFNGRELAELTPTEYVQMSGRAGRRGLDTFGTSIIICHGELPRDSYLRNLFGGKVEALHSQFYLKFNMILNLMRVRDIGMVDLLRRSLSANLTESMMPELVEKLKKVEQSLKTLPKIDCVMSDIEDMGEYGDDILKMCDNSKWIMQQVDDKSILRQLQKGRVVYVLSDAPTLAVISENPKDTSMIKGVTADGSTITFKAEDIGVFFAKPSKSAERMNIPLVKEMLTKFNENPLSWAKIFSTSDFEFVQAAQEQLSLYASVERSPCFRCSLVKKHLEIYSKKVELTWEKDELNIQMHDESLAFKPLLDSYVNLLKHLNYVTSDNVLMLKGRVCIEINSCHEVFATELLFSGIFDDLHPAECASLCSTLVAGNTTMRDFDIITPPNLEETFEAVHKLARKLFDEFCNFGIPVENSWIAYNFNPVLANQVLEWAIGQPFKEIMGTTDVPEGNVVRLINMVNEVLRDLSNAARVMGCWTLASKFEQATEMIRRDIIFASSLYFE